MINNDLEFIYSELSKLGQNNLKLLQFQSLISAYQYARLYKLAKSYIPTGSTVLDWGCGNGHFSYFLGKYGYKAWGFSFKDFPLRNFLCNYNFCLGTPSEPTKLPYHDGEFDAVVSVGVLEHVRKTKGTEVDSLREISRILKPYGFFVCYHLPNRFSIIEAIGRTFFPSRHYHKYRYTNYNIGKMCEEAGFKLLEMERYALLPRNSWNYFPKALKDSRIIAIIWNLLDNLLSKLLSPICQNYLFVAQKIKNN